ncbi:MAG TPA: carboxyl transferase domain-containing protein [Acidimicrobiia bacterium]|nr:carboxyl transferase domain-containing protein [Acidimicrobiia bacterium]
MSFTRIAVVNRGEPAMRLIHAATEYNAERGTDLTTIALFTEPDRKAMFVREADEAYFLGPAHVAGPDGTRRVAYVNYELLEKALVETRADAVWVGWGFVAEHAAFAELCTRLGIVFIGPDAEVMRRLGDKITSKQIAEAAEVPVAPWSRQPVETVREALAHADNLGYPVMIKASAGGGGRGIRRVRGEAEMEAAFEAARSEAASAFGDGTVFLESLVTGARHIEVQIIGDDAGTVWPVGVRDCTVQRRNQKVIEEAPSPVLTAEQDTFIREAAARLGRAAGYRNAGTVEFLYDERDNEFYFMEVNTRLQVEHPITELTTGFDLVKGQIDVARGLLLDDEQPTVRGHAIEVRLNAEDPDAGFSPAPGEVEMLRMPSGPGIRIDTGVEEGDVIAPEFDSMIAKIMARGRTREEARSRLRRALSQMRVIIRDGASNKAFLEYLLGHPDFIAADYDVGWLDQLSDESSRTDDVLGGIALIAAAISAYRREIALELRVFKASAARGRPEVSDAVGHTIELRHRGERYSVLVGRLSPEDWRISVDDHTVEVSVEDVGRAGLRLRCGDRSFRVLTASHGASHYVEVDGVAHRVASDEGGIIRAPSPAIVVSLPVQPGDEVAAGDRIAVIEAMKMETSLTAEYAGTVRELLVRENVQVSPGTPLLVIDPATAEEASSDGRIDFAPLAVPATVTHTRCMHYLAELRALLLGWDITANHLETLVNPDGPLCVDPPDEDRLRRLEDDILGIFVDIVSLFRRHPVDSEITETRRSSEEYLFNYLRDLESKGDGLPEGFVERIRRTVAHYGLSSLDPGPDLERVLLRIAKSYARMAEQTRPILRVLEDRLEHGSARGDLEFRHLLERLLDQTRGRYPAVHDMAREVHYHAYDVPFLERVRRAAYADVEEHLAYLGTTPLGDERPDHVQALVDCTQPLSPLISRRFGGAPPDVQAAFLEVMTRRYYRIRQLGDFTTTVLDDHAFVASDYVHEGRRIHVMSAHAAYEELADAARAMRSLVAQAPVADDVIADFYLWQERSETPDIVHADVNRILNEALGPAALRRVVVAISAPESGFGLAGVLNLTFRPDGEEGYAEERFYRDLHPMMSKRLEIWRLAEFDLTRLPSLQDIYLFHGVARDNPKDERLFGIAEVRDLTPLRDEQDRAVRIPEFERVYRETLGPMRRFQARRPAHRRLWWNRVMIYVWPLIDLADEEIRGLIDRLAPETEGLGLEIVSIRIRVRTPDGQIVARVLEINNPSGAEVQYRFRTLTDETVHPLRPYDQQVVRLRRRGLVHPHELVNMLAPQRGASAGFPPGEFVEHELEDGRLVPVDRPRGRNPSNVVVGLVSNRTMRYPEGITRAIILSDPTRGMGNLAEPECARINAAIDLAEERGIPVEWFAVSAGALISMESGTENMDWIGRVLRRIIEFTQSGGEINIVVGGINVGAQPYWNAEATMLMHTKGILVMIPTAAMVLTGKEALDYSGGVSAEDNRGIGGYERIMGPNGQAQYFAQDMAEACRILLQHYEYTYVIPGERFPRLAETDDPFDRDITNSPHGGEFATVGEVFSEETNPGRKRAFEMRAVMEAVVDNDHPWLERWYGMQGAETSIVWDAYLGGMPVTLIGFESKPMPRLGGVPADGPRQWTSGTLFPNSSKKTARAINAASNSRPVVVLANLSGFDGSPESMRNWQLEYGAEIGRAIVNFRGPIVFCVVSRYHGGAFVVFSQTLHDNMEVAALEGSHASVIGGAPAAAVVFAREVRRRTDADSRVTELAAAAGEAMGAEKARLAAELEQVGAEVHSEKLGEVADDFDSIHSVQRALAVGSIHHIIPPPELRSYLIAAVQRGIARELESSETRA